MIVRRTAVLAIAITSLIVGACASASPPGGSVAAGPPSAPSASIALPTASPTPSPTQRPSPSATAVRVNGLTLTADPDDHIGACPLEITFLAKLTTSGGPGTVAYRWVSSDGDTSPTKTIDVKDGAPTTISSTWTVDRTTMPTHAGWSSIELVGPPSGTPEAAKAARADFVFTCDADDDIEAIGFGIGGSDADCSIKTIRKSFGTTDPIRVVANWWPSLADGTVVTIRLTREGTLVAGYPVTTNLHESTKCVHGPVSQGYLAPGHYRLDLAPDTARAIGGEFDVK
jgi:hypothetical protein